MHSLSFIILSSHLIKFKVTISVSGGLYTSRVQKSTDR